MTTRRPLVCAIAMGYGHLRPAHALAEQLGEPFLEVDRPPLADPDEQKLWARTRFLYEGLTRLSQHPRAGAPLRSLLGGITAIPNLYPLRDMTAPTGGTRFLQWMADRHGLGHGVVDYLRKRDQPLLTTFFAPAVIADHLGCEDVHCVVTDSDINRVWAPFDPARSKVRYYAPSTRVVQRLRAYGVPAERIEYTGFPLPHALLGGHDVPAARRNLAARLVRLDPDRAFRGTYRDELEQFLRVPLPAGQEGAPPRVVFAVGGAGAQVEMAAEFLPGMAPALKAGRYRLTLVAGVRSEVRERFERWVEQAGLAVGEHVDILFEGDVVAYFEAFNRLLADTDVLWTKPSEITFFAALGLPLVFSWPVGVHEQYNRRWGIEAGAGLKQRDPRFAAEWLAEWLADGTLAAAAWNGFMRLPKFGLYRILERFGWRQDQALAG
jgi:hypothetical protein